MHWNEYIFLAYTGHCKVPVFLTGIPDIRESLPHTRERQGASGKFLLSSMHQEAIIDEHSVLAVFSQADGLPRVALRAAATDRTRLAPRFIALIEEFLTLPPAERPKQTPFFFIFHLLGDWREKAAYRTLAKFLRLPEEHLCPILGDAVTSTVNRVMVQVFDGDTEPLFDVIRDKHACEFVRSRMCDALATLVLQGNLDRKRAEVSCATAFRTCKTSNQLCLGRLDGGRRKLGLEAYSGIIETAFNRQYIDPGVCGYKHFLEDLSRAATEEGRAVWLADDDLKPFGDTVDELSRWHCFYEERLKRAPRHQVRARPSAEWLDNSRRNQPVRATKFGRNASCPCGSGKKFKKCCAA